MSLVWESVSFTKEKTDCHDQFENWSRNDSAFCNTPFFYAIIYRSSRKYARPREAGGWFSRLLRMEESTSTMMVTT